MRDWARAPRLVGGSWRKDRGSPRRLGPLLFLFLNSWKLRFRLPQSLGRTSLFSRSLVSPAAGTNCCGRGPGAGASEHPHEA